MDEFVSRVAHRIGKNLRSAKRSFDRSIGKTERPHIVPYRGYGNAAQALIMGRALRDPGLTEAAPTDNWLKNLVNSYKRIETDELPGARVRAYWGAIAQEIDADDEGFFRATLPFSTPPAPDSGHWHNVRLELVEPHVVDGPQPTATAQIVVPPVDAQFGIISDLDDTVIQTGATDILRMVQATLLGNARTRVPFPGVAAFYAALQQGATGTAFNPIFYVSSSPWNLYDVIEQFLALQRIPMGPTLLRDWGMSIERLPIGHAAHKNASIRHILDTYPLLRFILIGDSGQQDPEIYRTIVREYPARIAATYIREVAPRPARSEKLRRVIQEVQEAGSTMTIAADTLAVARHAAEAGWISADALTDIAAEKQKDLQNG
ncbi:MAG TPA: phosphatase domain-containing protein [Longimicrobiales bacterium]